MTHEWLEWARGPLFRCAFVFMVLGLARLLTLQLFNLHTVLRRSGNKQVPLKAVLGSTLRWLLPHRRDADRRVVFTVASMLFHAAVIITPVFLGAHVVLWERGCGISWPAVSQSWADGLTIVGVVAGIFLLGQRVFSRASRELSRTQDFFFPVVITTVFAAGFLAMHPAVNPFSYDATMLVHVLCGNLVLVLVPFSKLSHVLLFPFTRLVSELGWHLVPGAGQQVAAALNKENAPI